MGRHSHSKCVQSIDSSTSNTIVLICIEGEGMIHCCFGLNSLQLFIFTRFATVSNTARIKVMKELPLLKDVIVIRMLTVTAWVGLENCIENVSLETLILKFVLWIFLQSQETLNNAEDVQMILDFGGVMMEDVLIALWSGMVDRTAGRICKWTKLLF